MTLAFAFEINLLLGKPYASPANPSFFHLPILSRRDRSAGIRAVGQVV
jgi:hypothetical protein